MMEYTQSLAIWRAVTSIMASIRERGAPREANQSQPEEVFVPFHLPPAKYEPTKEAQPPVAVPASSSEALPIGV
ncbi:MAG: hypothetical protein ACJ8CB_10395 [Ktedonobacteraceae bacterium]